MKRRVISCLGVGAALALGAMAPLGGCESGGLGGLAGAQSAMERLAPAVKEAASAYIANLESLTSSLANLRDLRGVRDFVERAESLVNEVAASYQTLAGTSGEERSDLLEAFGSRFAEVNSAFLEQSDDALNTAGWRQVLSPVLNRVQLFE